MNYVLRAASHGTLCQKFQRLIVSRDIHCLKLYRDLIIRGFSVVFAGYSVFPNRIHDLPPYYSILTIFENREYVLIHTVVHIY